MLVFIDIETTGLIPTRYGILEIYAEVYGTSVHSSDCSFHAYIHPKDYAWQASALRMHIKNGLLDKCIESSKDVDAVMQEFYWWIQWLTQTEKVTFVGKGVDRFDVPFLLCECSDLVKYIHYNSLDIGSLLYQPHLHGSKIPSLTELCVQYGLPEQRHRACDDVAACIALYREHFQIDDLK
jgi:oligoribonuclease (3'-5' exoribonuclease)